MWPKKLSIFHTFLAELEKIANVLRKVRPPRRMSSPDVNRIRKLKAQGRVAEQQPIQATEYEPVRGLDRHEIRRLLARQKTQSTPARVNSVPFMGRGLM